MLKNADVVLRRYERTFEVLHKGEAIETEHKVLTLLNQKAEALNTQVFFYDQIVVIVDIEGAIYDGQGQLLRRIKKKDIENVKQFEFQFVNDNRLKIIRFPRLPFPYTIEYKVVSRHKGLLFYPDFQPQRAANESVELARFELLMPSGLEARYKEKELPPGSKTGPLRWEFRNLSAFAPEPFTPPGDLGLPRILTALTVFTIEGYEGDMSSWQSQRLHR